MTIPLLLSAHARMAQANGQPDTTRERAANITIRREEAIARPSPKSSGI
jgi:hypothetical protein